jgi:hypothetical protein
VGIVVGLMWGLGQDTSLGIVVGQCGASGATHFTGYCWFMWHLGQPTLLSIVVGLCGVLLLVMLRLWQHTLLAIVVGICMRGFLPLLNGLLDAANLLKYVQHVRRYFCA